MAVNVDDAVAQAARTSGQHVVHTFICEAPTDATQMAAYDTAVAAVKYNTEKRGAIYDFEATNNNDYLNEEISRAIQQAENTRA